MAPNSVEPAVLELHGSDITKPQPLRIIKRSKTISGSDASGEVLSRGRSSSCSSDQSPGSSPMGSDRPITVRKRRKGRGSILDGRFEGTPVRNYDGHSSEANDPETTPKGRPQVSKSTVAGAFLKSELQYPATTAGRYSARASRNASSSEFHAAVPYPRANLSFTKITNDEPKTTERKLSKSKNFLLKAIGGRSPEKKDRKSSDEGPKNTLMRRLSRSKSTKSVKSTRSGGWSRSRSGSMPYIGPETSHDVESRDITDISRDFRPLTAGRQTQSSSGESSTRPLLGFRDNVILSPQVVVTPEESIVDSGNCSFWVAIEISGVLRTADGCLRQEKVYSRYSSSGSVKSEISGSYGYLHSMKIEVLPSPHCFITQFIGDVCETFSITAGETRLILARINLGKLKRVSSGGGPSSDKLIADLETHLGDTHHPYLTVRLSYKHSGFLNEKSATIGCDGSNSHVTHLQTDVVVAIQRHDSQSAWSPRNSQSMTLPVHSPLIDIIRQHLPENEAEDAIVKLHTEQAPFPFAHRGGGGSSEETVKPHLEAHDVRGKSLVYNPILESNGSTTPLTRSQSVQDGVNPFARLPSRIESDSSAEESDPARKIWNEMRLTSRGRLSKNRLYNLDTDEYYSIDQDVTPTRTSSSNMTSSTLELDDNFSISGNRMMGRRDENSIDQERNMIMEIALKNKRSLGAETLRSIAPSLAKGLGKSKAGAVNGLGLGGGRTWGWNPPWW